VAAFHVSIFGHLMFKRSVQRSSAGYNICRLTLREHYLRLLEQNTEENISTKEQRIKRRMKKIAMKNLISIHRQFTVLLDKSRRTRWVGHVTKTRWFENINIKYSPDNLKGNVTQETWI
jgi:hypothetical protein